MLKKWEKSKYYGTDPNEVVIGKSDGAVLVPAGKRYHIKNLSVFAGWLHEYLTNGTQITVIGDYDCDGVSSDAVLDRIFRCYGREDVEIVNPRRLTEGYGFSVKILDRIRNRSGVIITVDNGIRAVEAVREAKARGYIVMVCDHHMPGNELPPADIIVDPHVKDLVSMDGVEYEEDSLFEHYCAAGLVYRLAGIMPKMTRRTLLECAAFAAIATIADVVPLTGDNRNIWREGKNAIEGGYMTEGLRSIIANLKTDGHIDEGNVGFGIAPPLNAPGRLLDNGADLSFSLLSCDVPYMAIGMCDSVTRLNEQRKHLKTEASKRAEKTVESKGTLPNPVIVCDPATEPGIVGLVAGYLNEKYERTSFVFTEVDGLLKGSARGHDLDDVYAALMECSEKYPGIIAGFGGHKKAAGVSVFPEKLKEFEEAMSKIMGPPHPAADCIYYDMVLDVKDVEDTLAVFEGFSPYGEGNPKPVVLIRGVKPVAVGNKKVSTGGYGMIKFRTEDFDVIGFGFPPERQSDDNFSEEMDIIGTLSRNYFAGKGVVQVDMIDFRTHEGKKEEKPVKAEEHEPANGVTTTPAGEPEVDNTVETAGDITSVRTDTEDGHDASSGTGTEDPVYADVFPSGMSIFDII